MGCYRHPVCYPPGSLQLDALAVGVSLVALKINIRHTVLIPGIVTAVFTH
ncbi:MAG: manganese efflux pump [Planctomycetota bacterium]